MAEGIILGIGEKILPKLASIAANEIGLWYNYGDDLKKLEDTLSIIKSVLRDAEELEEKSYFLENRIAKLGEVLYDADDLLDNLATEDLRRNLDTKGKLARQVCDFFSSSNHLAFRHKMGYAIREIKDRLDQITSDISKFNFINNRVIVNKRAGRQIGGRARGDTERKTGSFFFDIIGREEEKREIIKALIGSRSDTNSVSPKVIPIVGIGGIGKTAFAKLVFDDKMVVKHFEPRIWVCVAFDFKEEGIVRNILRCIKGTIEEMEDYTMEELQKLLSKRLNGKRCLIVLDDVWHEDKRRLIKLKELLTVGSNGSKIVVTTRSSKVAYAMGGDSSFVLKRLTDKNSMELFVKLAFREGLEKVHPKIIEIGKKLIGKCKGVPLAIKTLGSTMRSKTEEEEEWLFSLFILNNEIGLSSRDDGDILSVLKFCYDQLPNHLKYCFTYCSIFSKKYAIEPEELIQLWMAQGFVQSPSQNLEFIGDQYFKDLLSISFFQDVEFNDYGTIISVKMHDLIHDLARQVAGTNYELFRHVSLHSEFLEDSILSLEKQLTRTLVIHGGQIDLWMGAIISNFRCVRVLDLRNLGIKKMPGSIGELKHLRYLDLSGNDEMRGLPNSISNLLNLQTLKLSNCKSLKKLPSGITKLINLRYLITENCYGLTHMPIGLKQLTSLQKLSMFVVGKKDKWTVSGQSSGLRLRELEGLNELRGKLSIKHLERIKMEDVSKANMKVKKYLQRLELRWDWETRGVIKTEQKAAETVLKRLEPHPELKELNINGYCGVRFPSWMMKRSNLVNITIMGSSHIQQLPPLDQLPFLKFLSLSQLDALEYIQQEEDDFFETLEYIQDDFYDTLEYIQQEEDDFYEALEYIQDDFYDALEYIQDDFYDALEYIQQQEDDFYDALEYIRQQEDDFYDDDNNQEVRDGQATSSSSALSFPSLQELVLEKLPKLKGWWWRRSEEEEEFTSSSSSLVFPQLTKLTIIACPMLTSMPLYPNLEELVLNRVSERLLRERLTTTSATAEEEEDKEAKEVSHHHQNSLSKLKSVSLWFMEDLEAMPTECLHNLTSLERLTIYHCDRLLSLTSSSGDGGEGFRYLTSLCTLGIEDCCILKSLSKELRHLTALEHLRICDCRELDLSDDDDGMHWQCLSSLRKLQIEGIPKLVNLPVGLQHLTTLRHLAIWRCDEFVAVPEWIGNLAQLQRLEFSGCPKFASLPQGICRLTSLQVLRIEDCPKLTKRCRKEIGEDWPNIAHIPYIIIHHKTIQGRNV